MPIQWLCLPFSKLTTNQLYDLLKLRVDVFVVEQNCPYHEIDGRDRLEGVYHLLGYDGEELAACARLLPCGVNFNNASIGRVITAKNHRGNGFGHELMTQAIAHTQKLWPNQPVDLGAQQHLESYYARHGFETYSDMYLEDGIPHVDMRLKP